MDISLAIQICILGRFLMLRYLSLGIVQPFSHVSDFWALLSLGAGHPFPLAVRSVLVT